MRESGRRTGPESTPRPFLHTRLRRTPSSPPRSPLLRDPLLAPCFLRTDSVPLWRAHLPSLSACLPSFLCPPSCLPSSCRPSFLPAACIRVLAILHSCSLRWPGCLTPPRLACMPAPASSLSGSSPASLPAASSNSVSCVDPCTSRMGTRQLDSFTPSNTHGTNVEAESALPWPAARGQAAVGVSGIAVVRQASTARAVRCITTHCTVAAGQAAAAPTSSHACHALRGPGSRGR